MKTRSRYSRKNKENKRKEQRSSREDEEWEVERILNKRMCEVLSQMEKLYSRAQYLREGRLGEFKGGSSRILRKAKYRS